MRGFVVYMALNLKKASHLRKLLLIAVLLVFTGCLLPQYLEPRDPPTVFYADYNKVWKAAVDALDESGFVIVQMRESDGYISTDKRERDGVRVKLSLRFYRRADDGVYIKFMETREIFVGEEGHEYNMPRWISGSSSSVESNEIRRKMYWKLPRPQEKSKQTE